MEQKLLTEIELDVQELKYLMNLFAKEPTQTLSDLLKRNIVRMQEHLDSLQQEVDAASADFSEASVVVPPLEPAAVPETEEPVVAVTERKPIEEERTVEENTSTSAEEPVKIVTEEEKEEAVPFVLGESLKLSASLRQSISLNDSFRFSRELFGGDSGLMNRVIEQLSMMSSYKTAVVFLSSKVDMDETNEAVNDFLELLKKYFNQPA